VSFEYKSETDLYKLIQNKTYALSLTVSPQGKYLAMYCRDKFYRIFHFNTGKLYREYNESLKYYVENYHSLIKTDVNRIEKADLDRRLVVERELEKYIDIIPPLNIQFDETNNYIFYSSILGIKLIDLKSERLIKILGKPESSERFLSLNIFQGKSLRVKYIITKWLSQK
jgi:peptidylprolyl isomerase domain and WD repeat-containing protein 1